MSKLSPSPSRRGTVDSPSASRRSNASASSYLSPSDSRNESNSSREPSASKLSPSPRPRRTLSDGRSSVESGDDDLLPVSARVQMWNQRHHQKLTSKPPPANKVFLRQGRSESRDTGVEDDTSAARDSTTSSPQPSVGSEPCDVVDGGVSSPGQAAASSEADMDEVVPWRRRRPSLASPSPTPQTTAPVEASPSHPVPAARALPALPAPAAPVCSPSSDSSDRDDEDKEVAALLGHGRVAPAAAVAPPPAAEAPAARREAPALPVLPALPALPRGAAPVCPAGEGLACRSRSTSPAPWYRDPESVLIACSYGLACAAQLADADFLTALGILLACLSLVAFLLIS